MMHPLWPIKRVGVKYSLYGLGLISFGIIGLYARIFTNLWVPFDYDTQEIWSHFHDFVTLPALKNTIIIAISTVIITHFFGLTTAFLIKKFQFKGSEILHKLMILPFCIPGFCTAIAWHSLLPYANPLVLCVLVFSSALMPYCYFLHHTAIQSWSEQYPLVAKQLGGKRWDIIKKIYIPLIKPTFLLGSVLVTLDIVCDYGVYEIIGIDGVSNIFFKSWHVYDSPEISIRYAALYVIMIGICFVAFQILSKHQKFHFQSNDILQIPKKNIGKRATILSWIWCLIPITLGGIIPIIVFLNNMDLSDIPPNLLSTIISTLIWVIIPALLIVGICFLCTTLAFYSPKFHVFIQKIIESGYAMPGALIAVMCIGLPTGIFILFFAYFIKYGCIASSALKTNQRHISTEMIQSARYLGATYTDTIRKIFYPLLKSGLSTAFLLTSLEILKEIPITLALKPFFMDTVALKIYDYASDDRLSQASIYAVCMIIVCGILLWIYDKQKKSDPR